MRKYNLESMRKLINSKNNNLVEVINRLNTIKKDGEEEEIVLVLEEFGYESRVCSICNKIILEGYCIEDGYQYACSDECLSKIMPIEQFNNLYNDGNGDSYYTEFTEIDKNGVPY